MPDFSRKRLFSLCAILVSLTACEPNEYTAVPVGAGGAGGNGGQSYQAPAQNPQAPMPIEDPEEEANAMGNNAQNGRIVIARSASHAQSRCAQYAGTRRTAMPEKLGNDRWRCRYY